MFRLFDHQQKGIDLLTEHDSFGLLWQMGSGKTLTMLMHLSNLMFNGSVHRILWLAPKSALGAVDRDLETMESNGLDLRAKLLRGAITAMNYEKLSRKDGRWRKMVTGTEWDAIVLDEAHCLCHPTSNRTKFIIGTARSRGLIERIKYRYAMTGTPVTNSRLEDFWSFMQIMTAGEYMSYSDFEKTYLKTKRLPNSYAKIIVGYNNSEALLEDVAAYSQSLTKEECLDLPDAMPDIVIRVGWSKKLRNTYEVALNDDILEATDEVFDNALVRVLRLRQLATGHAGEEVLDTEKLSYAMELIQANPNKTVVFYNFKMTFKQLTDALRRAKIPFMYLNGEQKNKNIWRDFQKASEQECRVFLVQYASGNAGIDLYTSTDTIFYEPCVSSTVLDQARSRTHRQGVTRACTYTFLLREGSVEEDIYRKLQSHEDFNEKLWIELKREDYESE